MTIVISAIVIIITGNIIYYKSLYSRQIDYIVKLLDRQVQIAGLSVDNTDSKFVSELNEIMISEDLGKFFSDPVDRIKTVDRMKLFFSKYEDLITGIKLYDNNKNEFTLKKDETGNNWLEQIFVLHVQGEIITREILVQDNRYYDYYKPLLNNNTTVGNIVATVDYKKYFDELFTAFNFQDFQWQWVVNDIGEIIYNNKGGDIIYSHIQDITEGLAEGAVENIVHKADWNGKSREVISSYYSTHLLQRPFGLVFSSPTDEFQNYIIRNSLLMGLGTLLTILLLVLFFMKYLKRQKAEIDRLEHFGKDHV